MNEQQKVKDALIEMRTCASARDQTGDKLLAVYIGAWADELDQLRQRLAEAESELARLDDVEHRAKEYMGVAADDRGYNSAYWAARTMKHLRDWRARAEQAEAKLALAEDDAIIGRQVKREMSRRLDVAQLLRRDEPKRIHADEGYRLLQQIVADAKVAAWNEQGAAIDASGEST